MGLCKPPYDPTVVSSNPAGSKGTDPTTGLYGIKWDQQINKTGAPVNHSFVLGGWYDVVEVDVVMKAGGDNIWGKIDGPSCDTCSASINVIKELEPQTDPGKFDLQIDGVTRKDGAGHGDSTGKVVVSVGDHTVGETASGDTDMDDYAFDISCVDSKGNPVTATQQSSDPTWTIYVGPCQDVICTITNEYAGTPTAVTLSTFAARSSAGGWASPLWLGFAGLTVLAAGFWAKRRSR
ncbi:MAG: hypothetical protein FJZ88_10005 [Chloroflexi bacterium]|nr:hypothetical protein [Chloroflexota bacterium]